MESMESKPGGEPIPAATKEKPQPRQRKHEAKHERTTEKLISQMIGKYISIEEKRALFLRDGAEACRDYRKRGFRATSYEVLSWIEQWDDKDESEGPRCHE